MMLRTKTMIAAAPVAIAAALVAAVLAFTPAAIAQDQADRVEVGDLMLHAFWTRAMLPGQKAGGGYVVIVNRGANEDVLVAVSTPRAARGEIHEMRVVDDVMRMRPLPEGLPIPAGETVLLKPGGFHLMFMAVSEPFREGETIPVTLTFKSAGDVTLVLPVAPAGARRHDHSAHDG